MDAGLNADATKAASWIMWLWNGGVKKLDSQASRVVFADKMNVVDMYSDIELCKGTGDTTIGGVPRVHSKGKRGSDGNNEITEYRYKNVWQPLYQLFVDYKVVGKAWNDRDFFEKKQMDFINYFEKTLNPCHRVAMEPHEANGWRWWPEKLEEDEDSSSDSSRSISSSNSNSNSSSVQGTGDENTEDKIKGQKFWEQLAYLCPGEGKLFHAMYAVENKLWDSKSHYRKTRPDGATDEPSMGIESGVVGKVMTTAHVNTNCIHTRVVYNMYTVKVTTSRV